MHRAKVGIVGVIVAVLFGGVGVPVWGQQTSPLSEKGRIAFADGVAAIQEGEEQQGAQLLRQVMQKDPAYLDRERGSVAYWLGRAFEEANQPERAISVWRVGIIALHNKDHFEVRLADAFIREVFRQHDKANYDLAADAYLRMVRSVDEKLTGEESERLANHLAVLALILPEDIEQEAGLPKAGLPGAPTDAGIDLGKVNAEPLLAWLRRADPLPATRKNERVQEHLERVAYAKQHYASSESPLGFDARGEIYVRYGAPTHKETINFNESRLTDEISRPGISINLSDFPQNEFWSYGGITRSGYYIFVEQDGAYQVGTIEDLVPRLLRSGFSNSERGQRRAYLMLATLRAIYNKLSPYHPELAARRDEIASYMAQVEDVGISSRGDLDTRRSIDDEIRRPDVFAAKTKMDTRNRDAQAARRREKFMPEQATKVFEDMGDLSVAARTARFLDPDGTTRTEIYWAPASGALALDTDQKEAYEEEGYTRFDEFVVRMTATQKMADYQERIVNQKHYRIRDLPGKAATIPAQTLVTRGDTTTYHLAMEWDEHLVDETEDGNVEIGPQAKVATLQKDSLQALISDERILEMSDLRVMTVPEGASAAQVAQRGIPYPFHWLSPETPLALYFEVYHLAFNGEDQTEYTVEYEVERRTDRGEFVNLVRGDEERRTTTRTTYEGNSRKTEEYVMVDLNDWEGNSDLKVTVRVTDELTGQQVERSVEFKAE